MSRDNQQDKLDALILSYLDGSLNQAQFDKLVATMRNDSAALDRFVELASLDRSLQDALTQGEQIDAMQQANPLHTDPSLSFEATLALLARGSESAELVHVHHIGSASPLKRLTPYLLGGAIAAVFVLAVTLTFVFNGKPSTPPNNLAGTTDETPATSPATRTVATLTNQHSAEWLGPDPLTGDHFEPNKRLQLIAGFAEITTSRGAVAILEAPATIQLTDSDNALRLLAGKLVGICETPYSKGFVVRTKHMLITDLGTRFGVDTSDRSATEVHVLEGSVQAKRTSAGSPNTESLHLIAGEAVRASEQGTTLTRIEHDAQRFASISTGSQIALRGTGQGLAVGEKDPHWHVVAIGGVPLDEPTQMGASDRLVNSRRLIDAYPGVKYLALTEVIVPDIARHIHDKRIRYTVRTTLNLPADVDVSDAALKIAFEADDQLLSVSVNDQVTAAPQNNFEQNAQTLYRMAIPGKHLRPGPNTIELEVSDLIRSNNFVWGFGIAWHLDTNDNDQP